MNRIERLIWEETRLNEIGCMHRKSRRNRGVKLVSIALLAGVTALGVSRLSVPSLDETVVRALLPASVVYTPVAASNPAIRATASPAPGSGDVADAGARAAQPENSRHSAY
jgi:hypothetical protein